MNSQINVLKCEGHNKALQRTAIPLRSIAAGELGRSATRSGEAHRRVVTFAAGGEVNESTPVVEESLAHIGASVMGRNMFGGHPGPWDAKEPWSGWWGVNPPFQHPVFVLTHYAREPLELEGGTTFTFVTDGIEAALEQARRAAGGKDVSPAGGASAAQQYLAAGLVDGMETHVVPTLLGSGERLSDGVGDDLHGLELVRTVVAPKITHLKFARR